MCKLCATQTIDQEALLDQFEQRLLSAIDLQSVVDKLNQDDQRFALDLLHTLINSSTLSAKQWMWVERLRDRVVEPIHFDGNFAPVLVMFRLAGSHGLKRPKVRLLSDDAEPVYFELWFRPGEQGEKRVEIMIGGWQHHGRRRFGGWLEDNQIQPYRADRITPGIVKTIEWLATDPMGCAQAMAKKIGACMYCGSRLTDEPSKAVGYGPICAKHYGLPWGNITAQDRKAESAIVTLTLDELFGA